jgi:hypothetical protein
MPQWRKHRGLTPSLFPACQYRARVRDLAALLRPRFARTLSLRKTEGAGKAGCPMHPQPRVGMKKPHELKSLQVHRKSARLSPRNGVTAYLRALPGDRALLPPSSARITPRKLDTSVGAPGPHDFAVRSNISRQPMLPRPSHPLPNVRDDRETSLLRAGDIWLVDLTCHSEKQKYFCKRGLTAFC